MKLKQNSTSLINSFNKIAHHYDIETSTFTHRLIEHVTFQNLLLDLPKPYEDLKILDLGGGTGKYSIELAKLGYSVTLSDISQESLNVATVKIKNSGLNIPTIQADAEHVPFNNGNFDMVLMLGGVMSYTPHPQQLLRECNRILKNDGILWFDFLNTIGWAYEISDPNRKTEIVLEKEKLIQMEDWDYPTHLFNYKFMESMVQKNHFTIKSKYGLLSLSISLPMEQRYLIDYDEKLLEKYKKIELELSRYKECYGSSWGCSICAKKNNSGK
ncbi:MAG: methyltransferase domain-containing protein [Spirochaetales bacterium]|nr:methyltransferase domain-containing protein [Spirochaetales bacterium]